MSNEENLVPIYDVPRDHDRLNNLKEYFYQKYNSYPEFYVRVPGRVNLIGEHVDYCGYGVCPMAIEQDMLLAVSKVDKKTITLVNVEEKYPDQVFEMEFRGCEIPEWHHYFQCGVRGAQEKIGSEVTLTGMNVAASGNIPPSAGLSSSSALVSAAALATFYANGRVPIKGEIADLCASAERYIGTQGGGMDQAIAFLATEGCAKFIEFNPLRSEDVKLPEGAVFVIAHSMVEKNKAASNDFNCRVVECRLAAQVIGKKKGLQWREIAKLVDLQNLLKIDLNDAIHLVKTLLHEQEYNKKEIAEILETTIADVESTSLTGNTKDLNSFKLQQRALHVFSESERVRQFKVICETRGGHEALKALGRLMYESHDSLTTLYECSHPRLDNIVEVSKNFVFGCRLTGAGWGGCTVALVNPDKVKPYMEALKTLDHKGQGVDQRIVFSTAPQRGACIYQ